VGTPSAVQKPLSLSLLRIVRRRECFFGFGIGDTGFLFREGEFEGFLQEGFDFLLDFLCQFLASAESDDPVVGISQIFEADKVWIVHSLRRESPHLCGQFFEFTGFGSSLLHHHSFVLGESVVEGISGFCFPFLVFRP
jgi:hypothetical protein